MTCVLNAPMEVERPTLILDHKDDQELLLSPIRQPSPGVADEYDVLKKLENVPGSPTVPCPSSTLGLCPVLKPSSPVPTTSNIKKPVKATLVGDKYLILEQMEGSTLYRCINVITQEEHVCKVVGREASSLLTAHYRVDAHPNINSLHEVLLGERYVYLVFPQAHGDLHSHVRIRKRLRESEARRLFRQIVEAVKTCHEQGIVLRDLKLRKFVFADKDRSQLKLETLEDAVVLDDSENDQLQDKRGCPAYVSPEILRSHCLYSGRSADMWSLGVILYTMLVGRYPFNDTEHATLFLKISRGNFVIPECLSSRSKCLIRALLQRDPRDRPSAEDVLQHPWLSREEPYDCSTSRTDQVVPDWEPSDSE